MRNTLLVSEEWCDVVFEHRNKAYGAYQLRSQAGRRYRWVALIFGALLLVVLAVMAALGLYVYNMVREVTKELEHVERLKPLKPVNGFEVKRISTGRRASTAKVVQGGVNAVPTVVDEKVVSAPIGIDGLPDPTTLEVDDLRDRDVDHNADLAELPIEGAQLVKTERVEELPLFPGGMQALMQYLDQAVIYTGAAQRRQAQGQAIVSFVVEADGSVTQATIEKAVDPALDRAILTAVGRMPKWKPGKVKGVPSPVKVTIPVEFHL